MAMTRNSVGPLEEGDDQAKMDDYRPMPIVFNEDDHYDFDEDVNNMTAAGRTSPDHQGGAVSTLLVLDAPRSTRMRWSRLGCVERYSPRPF